MRNFTDMDRLTNFSAQIGTRWEQCARQTWLRTPPRLDFWRAVRETLYFFLRDFEGRNGLSPTLFAIESCYVGD